MAVNNIKRRPDGKWELIIEDGKESPVVADTKEEAERLATAYLEKLAAKTPAAKRVVRTEQNKPKTSVLAKK